jgi:hypothetical protein
MPTRLRHARDELALGIVKADVRTGLRDTSVPGIGHEAVEIDRPPVGRTTDLYAAQVKITSECWCCPTTCLHIRVPPDGRTKFSTIISNRSAATVVRIRPTDCVDLFVHWQIGMTGVFA